MGNNSNPVISAFAYETGQKIEDIIDIRTQFLRKENERLQALILSFSSDLHRYSNPSLQELKEKYDKHFGIVWRQN